MANDDLYKSLAWCYEFITNGVEHSGEAAFVKNMVKRHKKSSGNELLNVACGHGWHELYLKKDFAITGVDLNDEMIELARKKNPEVRYIKGDMKRFKLKRKFDVVMSFDALQHNINYNDLKKTLANLSAHLRDKGVLLFHMDKLKENFKEGYGNIGSEEFNKDGVKMLFSQMDYDENPDDGVFESILSFIYAGKDRKLELKYEKKMMGLFELERVKNIMLNLGFEVHVYKGFSGKKYSSEYNFPLFVCTRKE